MTTAPFAAAATEPLLAFSSATGSDGVDATIDCWVVVDGAPEAVRLPERVAGGLAALDRHRSRDGVDAGALPDGTRLLRVTTPELRDAHMAARYAGQMAGRWIRRLPCRRIAVVMPDHESVQLLACIEGVAIGLHEPQRHSDPPPERQLVAWDSDLHPDQLRRSLAAAKATLRTRAMVEAPANELTPERFAELAIAWAERAGLTTRLIGPDELEREGFVATHLIGGSSVRRPCAVVIGDRHQGPVDVAIIGKGVTFDSGGISLKPPANMGKLKGDMAGAAAALNGALAAAAEGPPRFAVVLPLAENLPDGAALRPGDVVTFADGTRAQIETTDAEGRMLLADGALYARRVLGARAIVTIGTLTKACITALGNVFAALYTHDDQLAGVLTRAGAGAGERLWRMPLADEYAFSLRTPVADIANSSDDGGGSILAAKFIERFAATTRWAHVDMSSIFFMDRELPWADRGYTGAGARLIYHVLTTCRPTAP